MGSCESWAEERIASKRVDSNDFILAVVHKSAEVERETERKREGRYERVDTGLAMMHEAHREEVRCGHRPTKL